MTLQDYHIIFVPLSCKFQATAWCRTHCGESWGWFITRYNFRLRFDHREDLERFKESEVGVWCLLQGAHE